MKAVSSTKEGSSLQQVNLVAQLKGGEYIMRKKFETTIGTEVTTIARMLKMTAEDKDADG